MSFPRTFSEAAQNAAETYSRAVLRASISKAPEAERTAMLDAAAADFDALPEETRRDAAHLLAYTCGHLLRFADGEVQKETARQATDMLAGVVTDALNGAASALEAAQVQAPAPRLVPSGGRPFRRVRW